MTDKTVFTDTDDAAELAELIDRLMEEGTDHIRVSSSDCSEQISVQTVKSTDCTGSKGACCQPTEYADDDE